MTQAAVSRRNWDVGGFEFGHVCEIFPRRTAEGSIEIFMPQERYANAKSLQLNNYGSGPFCKFTIPTSYRHSGVYIISVDGEARYVGECTNLSARFNAGYGNISPKNCFVGGQQTNCRVNSLIFASAQAGSTVELWFFPTDDYKITETVLRSALRLAWNRI